MANCIVCGKYAEWAGEFYAASENRRICEACLRTKNFISCPGCGYYIELDRVEIVGEYKFCPICVKYYKTQCTDCGAEGYKGDYTLIYDGRELCKKCVKKMGVLFECFRCHKRYSNDNAPLCPTCRQTHRRCTSCGAIKFIEDFEEANVCTNCFIANNRVVLYHDFPVESLGAIGIGPHYYGIELEVEVDDFNSRKFISKGKEILKLLEGFAVLKSDSSITNGFEIVTRPASFAEQKRQWENFFFNLPSGIRSFQTDTCGLHIHTSKEPLSDLTIGKLLVFVNTRQHRKFIEKIAGRTSEQWAAFKSKTLTQAKPKLQESRYEALNILPSDTIEFRIFKGTLKRESFFKALEFVDCLVKFSLSMDVSLADWNNSFNLNLYNLFIQFIQNHKKDYPHLWGFISAKVLGIETKESIMCGYEPEED